MGEIFGFSEVSEFLSYERERKRKSKRIGLSMTPLLRLTGWCAAIDSGVELVPPSTSKHERGRTMKKELQQMAKKWKDTATKILSKCDPASRAGAANWMLLTCAEELEAKLDGNRSLAAVNERAQANGLPVMIHTGISIFPGARDPHAPPMLCDHISIDHPNLVVILAHEGRPPWMDEAFLLVPRHRNMYMDISGIPPQKLMEYFPRIEEIADKVLWGTDWPGPGVLEIKGNIEKFNALPIRGEAKRRILHDNAARLFPR